MDETPTKRTCPKGGSDDYRFRSRRKVADEHGDATETKFACQKCGYEWRVRTAQ
jgi:DNA-directed RNA polymerase subunit M/transcription elongation factor TFIIS